MSSSRLLLLVPEQLAFVSVARPSNNHPTFQLSATPAGRFDELLIGAETCKVFAALGIRLPATETSGVTKGKELPKCIREIFVIPVIDAQIGINWFELDSQRVVRWESERELSGRACARSYCQALQQLPST